MVLAGSTYTSRLWCVTEVFVWLRMGGPNEAVRVHHLSADARNLLANFNASKAQCFKPKDKQHLLAVIESGFGDLVPFNKLVRNLFEETSTAKPTVERKKKGAQRMDQVAPHAGKVVGSAGLMPSTRRVTREAEEGDDSDDDSDEGLTDEQRQRMEQNRIIAETGAIG